MKIGIVSDTHSRPLPKQMIEDFKNVDMIIHAGDFCALEDYQRFAKMTKSLKAVYGNMDELKLCKKLPQKEIFECQKVRIGIFHGMGVAPSVLEKVQSEFAHDRVNVVVFGHSHQAYNKSIKNVLYFNPGSPNDKVSAPYCSYGLLTIDEGKFSAEIIKIK
ncbi:MAG: metallophosphatase family protein [Candidatus Omnitrophica bacterium]|nr:metallophosphatase family protein [Candidatus Omnitrophota bacterium]